MSMQKRAGKLNVRDGSHECGERKPLSATWKGVRMRPLGELPSGPVWARAGACLGAGSWSRLRAGVIGAAVAAGVALQASPSAAFCRTTTETGLESTAACVEEGLPLFWANGCVPFGIHLESAEVDGLTFKEVHAAFERAFETWANADCGDGPPAIALVDRGKLSCDKLEFLTDGGNTNNNIAFLREEHWPYTQRGAEAQLATLSFVQATGEIVDVDIELNASDFEYSTTGAPGSVDLESAFLHAIGHALGIGHSEVADAVMNEVREAGSEGERRSLTADDVDAVCSIYPPDETLQCPSEQVGEDFIRQCASPVDTELKGNCQNSLTGAPATGGAGALVSCLLALSALVRRRKRS